MSAPTLISYTETAWDTVGLTKSTASISWNAGDVIVVIGGSEGADNLTLATATGLTFVPQKSNNTINTCASRLDAVVAGSSGSSAVTMTNDASGHDWGFAVWVWRNSAGIGNSVEQHTGGSAPTESVSLTPTAADGAIVWGLFDFQASALGTIVPTPTNTRQRAVIGGTHYTIYVADLGDQTSAGGVLYGVSGAGSVTGPFSIVAMEIKAGTGSGDTVTETLKFNYVG